MLYVKDTVLERAGVLDFLAEKIKSGEVRLHEVSEELKKLYPVEESFRKSPVEIESFYHGHGAEALRRAVERRYGIRLEYLRQTALANPVRFGEDGVVKPSYEQYLGGDGISIVGPLGLDVEVLEQNGSLGNKFSLDRMIPLNPCRPGIVDGISYGIRMLNALKKYGESGRVNVRVRRVSKITRSPTISFCTDEDIEKVIRLVNEKGFMSSLKAEGTKLMKLLQGELADITTNKSYTENEPELSLNFIYHMYGDYLGHEAATRYTGELLRKFILPILEKVSVDYETLWIAGGEDGDLRPSRKNIRGRNVSAEVFLPANYLENEFVIKKKLLSDDKTVEQIIKSGPSPKRLVKLNRSKYWTWNDTMGTPTHTGMEPEIVSSIFAAIRPPSPPFISSIMDVKVTHDPSRDGVIYKVETNNFEWGIEGIRTPLRTECESIMGIDGTKPSPTGENSIKAAALTIGACLAGGLNQHRLGHTGGLSAAKKKLT